MIIRIERSHFCFFFSLSRSSTHLTSFTSPISYSPHFVTCAYFGENLVLQNENFKHNNYMCLMQILYKEATVRIITFQGKRAKFQAFENQLAVSHLQVPHISLKQELLFSISMFKHSQLCCYMNTKIRIALGIPSTYMSSLVKQKFNVQIFF